MMPEHWQLARHVAGLLAQTENELGLFRPGNPLTYAQRIDAVLQAAMEKPSAISVEAYEAFFILSQSRGAEAAQENL
jgi:hypothetical protein